MPARSASPTSCGGSSVMWVGMCRATSSPMPMRYCCSSLPQGSGTASDTPIVGTADDYLERGTRRGRPDPEAVEGAAPVERKRSPTPVVDVG